MNYTKKLINDINNIFNELNILFKNKNIKYCTKELIKIHSNVICDYEKCNRKSEYIMKYTNIHICWLHSL